MIDINNFFNPLEYREWLRNPILTNGFKLATNGHIAVIIPDIEGNEYAGSHEDSIRNIFSMITSKHEFLPIPTDIVFPESHQCKVCKGTGFSHSAHCNECEGDGEVYLTNEFNDYQHDCKSCSGAGSIVEVGGDIKCKYCNDGVAYEVNDSVQILNLNIKPKYLNYILDVPGIEVAPYPEKKELYFKVGEINGLICGMSS
jgi:hypothetical protein